MCIRDRTSSAPITISAIFLPLIVLGGGWFGAAWGLPVLAAIALLLVISIAAAVVLALRRPRPAGATPA